MRVKKRRQIAGFSLIEVLIASGLMALVSAGLISMVTTMGKEQNNQLRTATFREIKTRIQYLITDQNSWNRTLAGNANMACIRDKTDCTPAVPATPWNGLNLYDSSGTIFFTPPAYNKVSPAWTGTENGFTDKGSPCNTFNGNTGAGIDTCPITYKIVWEPICPPVGTCKNPLIKITARMVFNASNSAQVAAMSMGDTTGGAGWTDDSIAAKTGKYDVAVKRSATTVNKSFLVAVTSIPTSGAIGNPGGNCPTGGGFVARGLTNPGPTPVWSEGVNDDPFDLVSVNTANVILQAGTYNCKIMSVAYAVDGFTMKLVKTFPLPVADVAGSLASGNAPKAAALQSVAYASVVLSPIVDTTYQLQQTCVQTPNGTGAPFAMGMPAQPYDTPSIFASLSCIQTN